MLLHSKENNQQSEVEIHWIGESICKPYINHIRSLFLKYIRNYNSKAKNSHITQLKNGQMLWIDIPPQKHKNGQKAYERCSTSLIIREMHIKTIMKHYHTPVRMAIRTEKRKQTSGIGESMWELETFYTIW